MVDVDIEPVFWALDDSKGTLTTAEVLMTEELHGQFRQGYAKDTVYGPIRQDLINAAAKGKWLG